MADEKKSVREVFQGVKEAINQSRVGRIADWFADNFGAFTRQGAKELAQVLPAFPDGVKPVEELGTLGNPTQLEVNEEKGIVKQKGDTIHGKRDGAYEQWLEQQAQKGQTQKPDSQRQKQSM